MLLLNQNDLKLTVVNHEPKPIAQYVREKLYTDGSFFDPFGLSILGSGDVRVNFCQYTIGVISPQESAAPITDVFLKGGEPLLRLHESQKENNIDQQLLALIMEIGVPINYDWVSALNFIFRGIVPKGIGANELLRIIQMKYINRTIVNSFVLSDS